MQEIADILLNGSSLKKKALFSFSINDDHRLILTKFSLWARYFFPKYFQTDDADFHKDFDLYNLKVYLGQLDSFTNIGFRGCAKTARTKLFFAYAICANIEKYRKYIRILSADSTNSRQIVTDIYNMLACHPELIEIYPELFEKSKQKREERMNVFTTSTGIKISSDTVGTEQRGALQEFARPDLIWYEDIESRKTLRSAVVTQSIWDNMEEARTGLAVGGGCIYTCNYVSERGNVHKLVTKANNKNIVLITPIMVDKTPTWPERYSLEAIEQMKKDDDDFAGERMCLPSSGLDVLFNREILNEMQTREPIREVAGVKIYHEYSPNGRYGLGADVAGGVGLDSSTIVVIDFATLPGKVVATYANNSVKPDMFAHDIARVGEMYGECIVAPESNNHGHATIAILKQIYPKRKIFAQQPKITKINGEDYEPTEYGFHTNLATKPKMFFDLITAVELGHFTLTSADIVAEAKSYTRDDLMDRDVDVRLATRHFDLLLATCIAFQMRNHIKTPTEQKKHILNLEEARQALDFDPYSVL